MKRFTAILLVALLTIGATTVFAAPSIKGNEISAQATPKEVNLSLLDQDHDKAMKKTNLLGTSAKIDPICEGIKVDLNTATSATITITGNSITESLETIELIAKVVDDDGKVLEDNIPVTLKKGTDGTWTITVEVKTSGNLIIGIPK